MEKLISEQLLSDIKNVNSYRANNNISSFKDKRRRYQYSHEISIFLSHKHEEVQVLEQVIYLLSELGVSIYVDWMDDGMPRTTCGYTAERIKTKIRQCKKFILLATEAAISSKWCNWELGLGDVMKYSENIAIMPITKNQNNSFSGVEYLQIYPIITSQNLYNSSAFYVEFNGNKVRLEDWLKY